MKCLTKVAMALTLLPILPMFSHAQGYITILGEEGTISISKTKPETRHMSDDELNEMIDRLLPKINKDKSDYVTPALQKMEGVWEWDNFATLPNSYEKEKDPDSKNRYYLKHQAFNKDFVEISVTFYGTKDTPDVAVVETYVRGAYNTQVEAFVKLNKMSGLTKLKSNCNFKDIQIRESGVDEDGHHWSSGRHLDFQQVYQFKNGNKILYMASSQATGSYTTGSFSSHGYTKSIITPHKDKLGVFMNAYGWSTNKSGKTIKCMVS